jgi:Holliday junction resolvase
MGNTYSKGRKAEQQVAQILRRAGASVKVSPGSRGAADLHADFGTKKWDVQVKAGKNAPTQLTGIDKQRLNSKATKNNTTPVLATVKNGKVEFRSNRCGRKLSP